MILNLLSFRFSLIKRGLLLPYRLEVMVHLLLQALVYDELKSYMSVGQHIRDAASYLCSALARASEPSVLKPFMTKIAADCWSLQYSVAKLIVEKPCDCISREC